MRNGTAKDVVKYDKLTLFLPLLIVRVQSVIEFHWLLNSPNFGKLLCSQCSYCTGGWVRESNPSADLLDTLLSAHPSQEWPLRSVGVISAPQRKSCLLVVTSDHHLNFLDNSTNSQHQCTCPVLLFYVRDTTSQILCRMISIVSHWRECILQ